MSRFGTAICAAVAIAAGGYWLTQTQSTSTSAPLIGAAFAQDAGEIDTSTIIEMVQGAEDAPIEMIEYASYTCPHCATFHEGTYKELKKDYIDTGKVKFIYREVYFDRYGLWASMVARCGGPEKFFGVSDLIFKGQSDWARAGGPAEIVDELRKIGRVAGLDNDALEACLQDGTKAQTLIKWYEDNAKADGVESTPSFIINGKSVSNQSYADFKKVLDAELAN